jgi:hypothetical protein
LQSNKAKIVAKYAHVVHSVDSASLAAELGKRARATGRTDLPLRVLVEVNVGGEAQKSGVEPSELPDVLARVRTEEGLALVGLMSMPPADDLEAARRVFSTLRTLRNVTAPGLPELSMGMSADMEVAVAEGATYVRVGTAIFGERQKS